MGVFALIAAGGKLTTAGLGLPAIVTNASASSPVVLVCEHASNHIPAGLDSLGLSVDVQNSHVAWDPGAIEVASRLSVLLDARLVSSGVSRLVYDCNRPPSADGAMPAKSEVFDIPGNAGLSDADRADRVRRYYDPFRNTLSDTIAGVEGPVLVTIHSFTPVYMGQRRKTDIGVLHDSDARLADILLERASRHSDLVFERNQPYGPEDGVTHTLKEHATGSGLLNVMLEIRNDLIKTPKQQDAMAAIIAGWLSDGLTQLGVDLVGKDAPCDR
ncbi:MAG: N-formylglutamate amidohydrolase [Marinosulfonomonas sp.]|nr:N-formylglutamate amidohydrolase [Marinosulfonomonas sp.]